MIGALLTSTIGIFTPPSHADSVPVYGGPTYDAATHTGFVAISPEYRVHTTHGSVGIAPADRHQNSIGALDERAFRIDANGYRELAHLPTGTMFSRANAINSSGTIVGFASPFSQAGPSGRPVRWDQDGTVATPLATLTYSGGTSAASNANAINTSGTIVGSTGVVAPGRSGYHAARWDAGGDTIVELESLGYRSDGYAFAYAYGINDAGTSIGVAEKFVAGVSRGQLAVRWEAGAILPVELQGLGADSNGVGSSMTDDINVLGEIVGHAAKFVNGDNRGNRAVRWAPGATTATELGTLGTYSDGSGFAVPRRNNAAGTAIGTSQRIDEGGAKGFRAVRWETGNTVPVELGNVGTDANGVTTSEARDINDAGFTVGYAIIPGTSPTRWAPLLWEPASIAPIDLNSFIDPASGWYLEQAYGISNTNWVTGMGTYDGYDRIFLMQIPEPGFALISFAALTVGRRRRR